MKRLIALISALLLMMQPLMAESGRFAVSTNLLDYLRLGTLNVDASCGVSRHWSILLGARYNPFTFNEGNPQEQFQYRQRSFSAGARWWMWHCGSGWWLAGKARYQEYNTGGIAGSETEEGDRGGLGLYAGYTYMLSPHWNLELGVGMWGGRAWYRTYSCPVCGITVDSGAKWFARPDDVMMSFVYVF